jgi:nitrile hydratase beta subunit
MDGMHDIGGREGFGPIDVNESEDPFHAPWEARVFGIVRAFTRSGDWNLDWYRQCRELIEPVDYLTRAYFDQWLMTYAAMMVNSGMATVEEIASGRSSAPLAGFPAPLPPTAVATAKKAITSFQRKATAEPQFIVGQTVRTVSHGHSGHTRLPAYARGRYGMIESYHGFHVLPDANASLMPRAEPLYTVAFDRAELWPEVLVHRGFVCLDLWESYFELR